LDEDVMHHLFGRRSFSLALMCFTLIAVPLQAQWDWRPDVNVPVSTGHVAGSVHIVPTALGINYFWVKKKSDTEFVLTGSMLSYTGEHMWDAEQEYAPLRDQGGGCNELQALALDDGTVLLCWQEYVALAMPRTLALRVDSLGEPMWDTPRVIGSGFDRNGMLSCSAPHAILLRRDATTSWIVWVDNTRIMRARWIDQEGRLGSVMHITVHEPMSTYDAVGDGAGGVVVNYVRGIRTGNHMEMEVLTQRLDSTGNLCWGANGLVLSETVRHSYSTRVLHHGDSTFWVLWSEVSPQADDMERLVVQRLTAAGATLLDTSGTQVTPYLALGRDISLLALPGEGVFVVWNVDLRELYANRISNSGELRWGIDGVSVRDTVPAVCHSHQARISPDADLIVAWYERERHGNRKQGIHVQRLDSSGNRLWGDFGYPVSTNPANQSRPRMEMIDNNVLVAWSDDRSDSLGLYTTLLRLDGTHFPIELLSFELAMQPDGIHLHWSARGEEELHCYLVQRKGSGGAWSDADLVFSSGMPGQVRHSYIDRHVSGGPLQYRLACIHHDGSITYSPVLPAGMGMDMPDQFDVYPNPVTSLATISIRIRFSDPMPHCHCGYAWSKGAAVRTGWCPGSASLGYDYGQWGAGAGGDVFDRPPLWRYRHFSTDPGAIERYEDGEYGTHRMKQRWLRCVPGCGPSDAAGGAACALGHDHEAAEGDARSTACACTDAWMVDVLQGAFDQTKPLFRLPQQLFIDALAGNRIHTGKTSDRIVGCDRLHRFGQGLDVLFRLVTPADECFPQLFAFLRGESTHTVSLLSMLVETLISRTPRSCESRWS
jgi:hypothetical protein